MRYWWVNQNRTYRQEVGGGYLWSPKLKKGGHLNPYYEFMREVAPGDLIFSFADTRIRAYGLAQSYAYEAPKPIEFGEAGRSWHDVGWRIDVRFDEIASEFRPADWIERLRPLLPSRYSPLLNDGRGVQSVYLTELPRALAIVLSDLIGAELGAIARVEQVAERPVPLDNAEIATWEERIRRAIESSSLDETEKRALVLARRGQGLFRQRVQESERSCRITGVARAEHLRASHIKPWRDSSNDERLSGDNGLMLTPSIDHLFDRGFISFRGDRRLLVAPAAHAVSLQRMGVPTDRVVDVGRFSSAQERFLEYHRDLVFLQARTRSVG